MTVGQRIKERRKEMKISADELGKRIGKNRATVFRYENGDIEKLPLDILEPIANALDTTPQFLMGWEDEKKTTVENNSGMSEAKQKLFALADECSDEEVSRLLQMMELFLGKK